MSRSRINADQPNKIDGVPIGQTTPAAVAATTLSASGATTLSGATALNGSVSGAALAVAADFNSATAGKLLDAAGFQANKLARATVVASTSGTSIDFTGIPSWAKRITVMLNGVSTSGTNAVIVQLGSTTFTATGYAGTSAVTTAGTAVTAMSTGFLLGFGASDAAVAVRQGTAIINNITGNVWCAALLASLSNTSAVSSGAGSISLAGVLDRVRVTTVGSTDTFDAGSINVIWE